MALGGWSAAILSRRAAEPESGAGAGVQGGAAAAADLVQKHVCGPKVGA